MLAERDHDFAGEQQANFRPVLDFFRRRLATVLAALRATEDVFRLAELQDGSAESSTLPWLLFQARAIWLGGGAGEPRLRFAVPELGPDQRARVPGPVPGPAVLEPGASGTRAPGAGAPEPEVPEPGAPELRLGDALADGLAQLAAKDRELLMLAYWDALPETEMTVLLDCNRFLLRSRLRRARKSLAESLPPSTADIAGFTRSGGGPVAAALRGMDPAAANPEDDQGLDLGAVARHTLKRISEEGAVFSDNGREADRDATRPATRSRRRWPVLASAVGLAAALGLAASAVNGLWNQDSAQSADAPTSVASAAASSAPAAVPHSRLRAGEGQEGTGAASDGNGVTSDGDSACAIRNVITVSVNNLFSTRDLTSHPEYFTIFGCAGGWMSFGISQEGRPYLAAPGPDTTFFLATLDEGGKFVFDSRQPYSIMASWQTVGAWAGQLGQGMSAPQLMDRQFEIKGGPVALRRQLVGDGLSDRL